MKQAPRTLLHLSDIHFGRDHALPQDHTPTGGPTLLDAIIKDLEASNLKPNQIIISGDLVSIGTREEYKYAKTALETLGKAFGLKPSDFLIVCGNHDVYWGSAPDSVSRGEFEAFISGFFHVPVGDIEPAKLIDDEMVIIGLDTTRLQRQSASGIGLIGTEQLRSAEQLLVSGSGKSAIRILVIHHHLLPVAWIEPAYPGGLPSLTLDATSVLSWAQEHGFAMILHGHQHQSFLATFHLATQAGGPLLVAGAPSAAAKDLPPQGRNGYHVIQLDGRNITVSVRELTEERRFSEARRVQFVREAGGTYATNAIPSARSHREPTVAEVRALTRNAAQAIKRVVAEAYGPSGGLRLIVDMSGIRHVRDGEKIAGSLGVEDPIQNRMLAVARDLAHEVASEAGDGRKTAMLLWAELVSIGLDLLTDHDEALLIASLSEALSKAVAKIRTFARSARTEDFVKVAMCAAGNQKDIGEAVVAAMKHAGKEGIVTIGRRTDRSLSRKTIEIEVKPHAFENLKLPDWYSEIVPASEYEVNHPALILCDGEVAMRPLIAALRCLNQAERPILIFARKIDEESLALLALNARRKTIFCIPFACGGPRNNGTLQDLSLLSGARIFNPTYGEDIDKISLNDIGNAKSITISREDILVTPSADLSEDHLMETVKSLRSRRDNSMSPYEKDLLQLRLARLVGSYVRVNTIGVSDKEATLFESEFLDAFHAARGAVDEGILPGAGQGFAQIAESLLKDAGPVPDIGTKLLVQALRLPSQLLTSAPGKDEALDSAKGILLGLTLATEAAIRTLRTRTVEVSEPRFRARDVADEEYDESAS